MNNTKLDSGSNILTFSTYRTYWYNSQGIYSRDKAPTSVARCANCSSSAASKQAPSVQP